MTAATARRRLAVVLAVASAAIAALAEAQDTDASARARMIEDVAQECTALARANDDRVVDCEAALTDMRRTTSPVAVARIRAQYRSERDEKMARAANDEFDMFEEREDYGWADYGDEIAD